MALACALTPSPPSRTRRPSWLKCWRRVGCTMEGHARFRTAPSRHFSGKERLIGNYEVDPGEDIRLLTLRPYEARVYRLR
jgi:hypothetical protein